jgi:hypothetical protein
LVDEKSDSSDEEDDENTYDYEFDYYGFNDDAAARGVGEGKDEQLGDNLGINQQKSKPGLQKRRDRKATILPIPQPNLKPPYICFKVVTHNAHSATQDSIFNSTFTISFSGLINDTGGACVVDRNDLFSSKKPNTPCRVDGPSAGAPLVIGRSQEADMQLNYQTVSGRHAALYLRRGQFMLQDMESSNGTFLYIRKPLRLHPGETVRVRMGRKTLKLTSNAERNNFQSNSSGSDGGEGSGSERSNMQQSIQVRRHHKVFSSKRALARSTFSCPSGGVSSSGSGNGAAMSDRQQQQFLADLRSKAGAFAATVAGANAASEVHHSSGKSEGDIGNTSRNGDNQEEVASLSSTRERQQEKGGGAEGGVVSSPSPSMTAADIVPASVHLLQRLMLPPNVNGMVLNDGD